ncbi:teichoic acid biosynthesis protein C [Streptomyces sp. NPDC005970]|uniref:phage baseplate protein n=1 Tax=Streptomyces sp. NPDC005970 TaxID=3156723 RepID=UPI0033E87F65
MTQDRTWNRRRLLKLGGGAAAGAALGLGAKVATASEAAPTAVPTSSRFDLTEPSYDLFRHARLHDARVQQSFCFDNVNRRLFVAQLKDGSADSSGDLCITQLDFSGNELGYMYLLGFGHAVSIAAQPVGTSTYLWTEVDVNSGARGKRLARFRWSSGTTLSSTSSALTKHSPVSDATETTCAIDPVNNRMAIRYLNTAGSRRYAIFNVNEVAAGNYTNRLADFAQPSDSAVFQGYTLYGSYVYQLTGTAYGADNPSPGNAYTSSVNVNTGALTQRAFTGAGSTLTYREPEGMGVYRTAAGEVRLFLGFASGEAGDRRSNLFYKNVLV